MKGKVYCCLCPCCVTVVFNSCLEDTIVRTGSEENSPTKASDKKTKTRYHCIHNFTKKYTSYFKSLFDLGHLPWKFPSPKTPQSIWGTEV